MATTGRRVLVTGGAGFIGSHVAAAFLRRGDEVVVLDNLVHGSRGRVPAGADFVEMDVRDPAMEMLVREGRFDVVDLHAAQIDVRDSVARPRHDAGVNVDGLLNVLEAVRAAERGRVVFASSGGAVYGDARTRPTPEGAGKRPESPYGVGKLAGEQYLHCFHRTHGLDYVALRYANVYGPGQDPFGEGGVVAVFCSRLAEGSPLTIYGDGEQTRDYVHVADVVRANLIAADAALPRGASVDSRAFNVGTGSQTSVNALASVLMHAAGAPALVKRAAARPGEVRRSALSAEKLRRLGWRPEVSLEQGLRETWEWVRTQSAPAPEPAAAPAHRVHRRATAGVG
ncbi:NAD-dependent epimerase/dehydratase family protein [Longimicrobium sp.]|uniref:NAD-dependent epimerase/dehydratase family protein n=1 Tax=Longimicrobium sp. TaxID=2029185 RepID=UPI002C519C47|nr:NAD-dependent epimerase/dehydratase family protein [Longimicrobium sp.]HSU13067.1 NAD-dependent epimerase/dehydratase family protein [Longimicrobium sp.]